MARSKVERSKIDTLHKASQKSKHPQPSRVVKTSDGKEITAPPKKRNEKEKVRKSKSGKEKTVAVDEGSTTPLKSSSPAQKRVTDKKKKRKSKAGKGDDGLVQASTPTKSTPAQKQESKGDTNDNIVVDEGSTTPLKSSSPAQKQVTDKKKKRKSKAGKGDVGLAQVSTPTKSTPAQKQESKDDTNDNIVVDEGSTTPLKSSSPAQKKLTNKKSRRKSKVVKDSVDQVSTPVKSTPEKKQELKGNTNDNIVVDNGSTTPLKSSSPAQKQMSNKKKRRQSKAGKGDSGLVQDSTPVKSTPEKKQLKGDTNGNMVGKGSNTPSKSLSPGQKRKAKSTSKNDDVAVVKGSTTPVKSTPTKNQKRKSKSTPMKAPPSSSKSSIKADQGIITSSPKSVVEPPTILDVTTHRIRHLDLLPRSILHLTSTSPSPNTTTPHYSLLATSREGGSVEITCPDQKFRCIGSIPGMPSRNVDTMIWLNTPPPSESLSNSRSYSSTEHCQMEESYSSNVLIGGSRDGTVFLLDFQSQSHKFVTGSGGGAVLCLAVLPNSRSFLVGCEDGSIRVFSFDAKTGIQLEGSIPTVGHSILSLTSMVMNGTTVLFAGVADATIRRYDAVPNSNGSSWKSTMRITVETHGRLVPTRIWSLLCLDDGTLISGDSLGHVQFWDGSTGTLKQTLVQNENGADVYALANHSDQTQIFASGVDSKIVCARLIKDSWVLTGAIRPHTHDVTGMAMVAVRDADTVTHLLCSGGVDTKISMLAAKTFGKTRAMFIWPWDGMNNSVKLAKEKRLIIAQRRDCVDVWKLADPQLGTKKEAFLMKIQIEMRFNLTCADISNCGSFIAVASANELMIFGLTENEDNTFSPTKLDLPSDMKGVGCTSIQFSPNTSISTDKLSLFCATTTSTILSLQIIKPTQVILHRTITIDTPKQFPIHTLSISQDNKYLATLSNSLSGGAITVYKTSNLTTHFSLPAMEASPCAMNFFESNLVAACDNNAFFIYDVERKRLTEWSEDAGYPMSPGLPGDLKHQQGYPVRLAFNPGTPNRFLMGGYCNFSVIDLDMPIPKDDCNTYPMRHFRKRQRNGGNVSQRNVNPNFTRCVKYNGMVFMDFMRSDELVVVEQPWLDVIDALPEALERKVYGN